MQNNVLTPNPIRERERMKNVYMKKDINLWSYYTLSEALVIYTTQEAEVSGLGKLRNFTRWSKRKNIKQNQNSAKEEETMCFKKK